MFGRLLFFIGVVLLVHCAYSVYEDRQFFVAQDREPTDIPSDVRSALFLNLFRAQLCCACLSFKNCKNSSCTLNAPSRFSSQHSALF